MVAAQGQRALAAHQAAGLDNSTIREALQSLHEQGTIRLGPDQAADDSAGRLHVQEVTERDFTQQEQWAGGDGRAAQPSHAGESSPLHLVSLFGGWGIARLA
eukprot:6621104-Pyramimonas_sp.AAC.1